MVCDGVNSATDSDASESVASDPPDATALLRTDDWGDEEVVVDGAVTDDESLADDSEPDSKGWAHAMPGAVASATPTPRAKASAPTRPICQA
jgi:hypothetical protein